MSNPGGFPKITLRIEPHCLFLILATIFGFAMVFLTPPFQVADELAHFLRAYQISEGTFISQKYQGKVGGWLPSGLGLPTGPYNSLPGKSNQKVTISRDAFVQLLNAKLDTQERMFWIFSNTSSYTFLVYAPQTLGILLGDLYEMSALKLMYLGRLLNLAAWIALTYIAIRIAPIARWSMTLLALTPMAIFQAASLSADAPVNGISFLWIAFCLYVRSSKVPRVQGRLNLVILVLGVSIVLAKQAYFPLLLLLLIIPWPKFGSKRSYSIHLLLYFLSAMSALALWGFLNSDNVSPMHPEANPAGQMRWLLDHPWAFGEILARTYLTYWKSHLQSLIGNLGWLDTPMPWPLILLVLLSTLLVGWLEADETFALSLGAKSWIFLAAISTFSLISAAIFVTWTTPGTSWIEGVQGRYFIPITPLPLLLMYHRAPAAWKALTVQVLSLNSLFISLPWCLWVLYSRYYV